MHNQQCRSLPIAFRVLPGRVPMSFRLVASFPTADHGLLRAHTYLVAEDYGDPRGIEAVLGERLCDAAERISVVGYELVAPIDEEAFEVSVLFSLVGTPALAGAI